MAKYKLINKLFIALLIISLLSIIAYGVTGIVNTFYNQENPFNITFLGRENKTEILSLPIYSYFYNISFNYNHNRYLNINDTGFKTKVNSSYYNIEGTAEFGGNWLNYSTTLQTNPVKGYMAYLYRDIPEEIEDNTIQIFYEIVDSDTANNAVLYFGISNDTLDNSSFFITIDSSGNNFDLFKTLYNYSGTFGEILINDEWTGATDCGPSKNCNITLYSKWIGSDQIFNIKVVDNSGVVHFSNETFDNSYNISNRSWAFGQFQNAANSRNIFWKKTIINSSKGSVEFNSSNITLVKNIETFFDNKIINQSFNISLNISRINDILQNNCNCLNCSISGENCEIPIKFKSDTEGILEINLTNATYSYGLDNCSNSFNIPSNTTSLFFNFKDEDNNNNIQADITTEWTYDINDGNTGTFDYDTNQIYNFSMCIYPRWSNIDTTYQIFYSNTPDFPQRRYNNEETLIDLLVPRTLYLLNLSDGIYGRFKTVDSYDNVLSGVTIQMRDISTDEVLEQEITDAAGLATFFLDPDSDYLFQFSKTGFRTESVVLRVTTTEIYTVSLEAETEEDGLDIETGTSFQFDPNIATLQNNTNYDFTFNLTSSQEDITNCTLFIYGNNTILLGSSSLSFNTSNCDISITQNTLNYSTITSTAIYVLNETQLTKNKVYKTTSYSPGQYSLKTVIDDLSNFSGAGFDDSGRFIIAFIVTFAIIGFIASKFTGIINAPALILLFWSLVGFFSYIGWLYMDFNTIPTIPGFDLKKYIIWILITLLSGGYIIKRMN